MDNKNNYKETHKKLIEERFASEERLTTSAEAENMQGILWKTLLWDLVFSPVKEKSDIKNIPEKVVFKETREYTDDLTNNLDQLEYMYREKNNFSGVLDTIDYILKKYTPSLIRWDYIDIMLKKSYSFYILWKYNNSHKDLEQISPYKKYFTAEQKDDFYAIKWNILFTLWDKEQDTYFFSEALECFDHIIEWANEIHTLDQEFYVDVQYKRAYIYCCLKKYEEAIPLFQELIVIAKTQGNKEMKINCLYLLWMSFEGIEKYQEAIDTLNEYLTYKDDEETKKYIRILSEKLSE